MSKSLISRKDAARLLTERGFKTSEATLATFASRPGGPVFRKYGQQALYDEAEVMEWAHARLSKPVTLTSDLHAA